MRNDVGHPARTLPDAAEAACQPAGALRCVRRSPLAQANDVYAFGVVLIELLTNQPLADAAGVRLVPRFSDVRASVPCALSLSCMCARKGTAD